MTQTLKSRLLVIPHSGKPEFPPIEVKIVVGDHFDKLSTSPVEPPFTKVLAIHKEA